MMRRWLRLKSYEVYDDAVLLKAQFEYIESKDDVSTLALTLS